MKAQATSSDFAEGSGRGDVVLLLEDFWTHLFY